VHNGTPHNPAIAGVWALREFPTGSTMPVGSSAYNEGVAALQFSGVTGYCARVHVDQLSPTNGSFVSTFLDQCMAMVNSVPNRKLAVRLIAGRYTPAYVFDTLGARSYPTPSDSNPSGNGRNPYACGTDKNTPNQPFVDWITELASDTKTWMLAQGAGKCPLLHWSWFANAYSEFYHGPLLQSDSTATQFVNASNALVDAAYALSDSNVAMSFGLSGTHTEDVQTGVVNHMTSIAGDFSSQLYFTANGLDDSGDWGATTEATQDANTGMALSGVYNPPAGKRVSHGEQDINPGNWSNAYRTGQVDQLIVNKSDFWEVYTVSGTADGTPGPAFTGSNAGFLQTQINRFVSTFGAVSSTSTKVMVID